MNSLQDILESAVAAGHAPGFVAAAITPSGEKIAAAAGVREAGAPAVMTTDTVFWIASCTKAITTVAALQLVERGQIDLDEPIGPRFPALANPSVLTGFDAAGEPITRPAREAITLRRLLTHTSGFAYDFYSADLTRYLAATSQTLSPARTPDIPLMFEPGAAWQYGIGIDWAGLVVEAVSGQPLADYFDAHILTPLGMSDTTFFPREDQAGRRAGVHQPVPGGGFAAIPFGMPPTPHFMMGGGGLYSTALDYLTFLSAILGGGQAPGGARILKSATVAMMRANQIGTLTVDALVTAQPSVAYTCELMPGVTKRWGLGFLINETPGPAGRSAGSLAWAGLANCYYWADPATGVAGILFSQLFPFADPKVLATFDAVERAVYGR